MKLLKPCRPPTPGGAGDLSPVNRKPRHLGEGKRQTAYILPKPPALANNFGNLQVIFPNQISESAKVRSHNLTLFILVK
jgi:hypothetical protein